MPWDKVHHISPVCQFSGLRMQGWLFGQKRRREEVRTAPSLCHQHHSTAGPCSTRALPLRSCGFLPAWDILWFWFSDSAILCDIVGLRTYHSPPTKQAGGEAGIVTCTFGLACAPCSPLWAGSSAGEEHRGFWGFWSLPQNTVKAETALARSIRRGQVPTLGRMLIGASQ